MTIERCLKLTLQKRVEKTSTDVHGGPYDHVKRAQTRDQGPVVALEDVCAL